MSDPGNHIARSALLIGIGMAIIGWIDNYVRLIAEDVGLWQFHTVRSAMALVIMIVMAPLIGRTLRPRRIWTVALRSALIAMAMLLYFGAVASLPIATAGAGLFTSPIWVLLISVVFLGMRIGLWRILAVAIGFAGMLLVLRPGADGLDPVAAVAVCAGLFYAGGTVATRHLCADESPDALLLGFFLALGLMGIGGLAILSVTGLSTPVEDGNFFTTGWQTPTTRFLGLCLLQAVGSLVAVFFLTRAYQIADPSYVSVFEYSFLLFAGVWAFILWAEVPDRVALAGIVAIIASGSAIIMRSRS